MTIKSSWTRGLALHPLGTFQTFDDVMSLTLFDFVSVIHFFPTATVVSLLAFAFALSEQVTIALIATLLAWVASLLSFVAFIIDLILFGWAKHEFGTLNIDASTATAPGELPFCLPISITDYDLHRCAKPFGLTRPTSIISDHMTNFIILLGTWVTFVAFVILLVGGFGTFCGRVVDRRAKRRAADAAAVETAHAKEAAAAAAAAHAQEKIADESAAPATLGKSNWASKFRFGRKAETS